jgi:enoyl-[acyl-carrier-protein] reductase (NADH)
VILMLTSGTGPKAVPMMGSTGPADAAMESLMRGLAAELGPQGVRVLGMWTAAVAETLTPEKIAGVNRDMQIDEAGIRQILAGVAQMTMLHRAPALAQVAETAAFLASERAGGITGSIVNVTCGMVTN